MSVPTYARPIVVSCDQQMPTKTSTTTIPDLDKRGLKVRQGRGRMTLQYSPQGLFLFLLGMAC